MKYDKLIRDKIPYKIQNKKFSIRVAKESELKEYILKKVYEELDEFIKDPCLEEAADVIEIIDKLFQTFLGVKIQGPELIQTRLNKCEDKGAFKEDLILLEVEE